MTRGRWRSKVLSVEYLTDEEIKSRFLDEGRMCQRLVHPNIVRVFDVGCAEDGTPFIVMELYAGVPLSAYTRSGVRVPLAQAAVILQGILRGPRRRPRAGHRAPRSEARERLPRARARTGSFSAQAPRLRHRQGHGRGRRHGNKTRTGVLLGTPAYMSRSRSRTPRTSTPAPTCGAQASCFYEMLAGRIAFARRPSTRASRRC